ncbi:unnamed protein product [Sphagnum jensenii]|uniref:Uncharacterized protein n=1 Tax=Sphagnum jensenii TaxID=128206 RepID=A0ABP0XB84_9BRYO
MGNGEMSKLVVVISLILFITAFGFALGAESKRSKVTSITIYPDGTFGCLYRGKSSIAFAAVALLLLLVAQLIVTITTRCLCCARSAYKHGAVRTYAIVAFIISWVFFATAFIFLIVGAIENHKHLTKPENVCAAELKSTVFALGAAFTFLTMLMSELYYILICKASISAEPPSVGLAGYV